MTTVIPEGRRREGDLVRGPTLSALSGRWRPSVVLKRDIFSMVERGIFIDDGGLEHQAVARRIDGVPWWSAPLAGVLLRREAAALKAAATTDFVPKILFKCRDAIIREWLDGLPLHIARPADPGFYRSALIAVRNLRRLGITHNDLAKQQNWLCTAEGKVRIIDFQLASIHRRRGLLFRMMAYEDFRHTLKQKRRYARSSMTPREWRIFGAKGLFTQIWMATGKPLYQLFTRRILNFRDFEGGGRRLANEAPDIARRLSAFPGVKGVAIVAYPDRRCGVGLYAFVAAPAGNRDGLLAFLRSSPMPRRLPEQLQLVEDIPRDKDGGPRTEILQLIALNQIDLIPPILRSDEERQLVAGIVAGRANLGDRFGYAPAGEVSSLP